MADQGIVPVIRAPGQLPTIPPGDRLFETGILCGIVLQ
jgi:hypothetical protein